MKSLKVSNETKKLIELRKTGGVDIGCGGAKNGPDFFGIDYRKMPGVDLVQDLEEFPWPIPTDTFKVAVSSHVVEHINPSKGIFINFMNECWRILKPGGEFFISAPYCRSNGMMRDPTHINFIHEETWAYFDPEESKYRGGLYHIYSPLPFFTKINTWTESGNVEVVLVKREIKKEYRVDSTFLKELKDRTNFFSK